jgi:hypothetical protein
MTGLHEVTHTTIFYMYFGISSEWNWKALANKLLDRS